MESKDGGPAFPGVGYITHGSGNFATKSEVHIPGMTLRDYFAGKALIALQPRTLTDSDRDCVGSLCYELADAMLRAREGWRE